MLYYEVVEAVLELAIDPSIVIQGEGKGCGARHTWDAILIDITQRLGIEPVCALAVGQSGLFVTDA